jgi:sensor domain CHASE-containing protein
MNTSERVLIALMAILLLLTLALVVTAVGNIDERVDRLELNSTP